MKKFNKDWNVSISNKKDKSIITYSQTVYYQSDILKEIIDSLKWNQSVFIDAIKERYLQITKSSIIPCSDKLFSILIVDIAENIWGKDRVSVKNNRLTIGRK